MKPKDKYDMKPIIDLMDKSINKLKKLLNYETRI